MNFPSSCDPKVSEQAWRKVLQDTQTGFTPGSLACWGGPRQKAGDIYLLTGQFFLEPFQLLLLALNLQLHLRGEYADVATAWQPLTWRVTTAVTIFVWPNYVLQRALSFVGVASKVEGESWASDSYAKQKLISFGRSFASLQITLRWVFSHHPENTGSRDTSVPLHSR
jgi:hypothetical protein